MVKFCILTEDIIISKMTVSDYIVEFFCKKGINHFFGYQGTMIAYFVDAIHRNPNAFNHSCYNEQGASFAACGYAQASGKCGVAYSTSGPGAVNLLSGVANAFFDSEPVIFITGQLNTYEYTRVEGMRQQGFQEINIVEMAKPITKYAVQLDDASRVRYELEKAWCIANEGRKGSVLLDIPMNIQRTVIDLDSLIGYTEPQLKEEEKVDYNLIYDSLHTASRPLVLVGIGVDINSYSRLQEFIAINKLPVVTSLLARDFMAGEDLCYGFIGGSYGSRTANLLTVAKADLLLAIGISLGKRQTGVKVNDFAQKAKLIRIDIDPYQLQNKIKEDEVQFKIDAKVFIDGLQLKKYTKDTSRWIGFANCARQALDGFDKNLPERIPNLYVEYLSRKMDRNYNVISDVGQHMMWMAQSFNLKSGQKLLFSGGHGAMGYALPAAIGAYYGNGNPCLCVSGDGSFQMNIQELQWIVRENIPIKIVVMNNKCLGMIRLVQEDYIESRYEGVSEGNNYAACDFVKVAQAYGIPSQRVADLEAMNNISFVDTRAELVEVILNNDTVAVPKTYFGEPIYNQMPYIPKNIMDDLLSFEG